MQDREMAPNLKELSINLPPELLEEANKIFEEMGIKPGEGHRDVWMAGFYKLLEDYNKLLSNRKMREAAQSDNAKKA